MLLNKRIKLLICRILPFVNVILTYRRTKNHYFLSPNLNCAETAQIGYPFLCTNPKNVYLEENTRINPGCKIIIHTGRFLLKKYSVIAYGCTIVTGNHTPTVGIPQFILGHSHINDVENDVVIEEDVWCGANVTLLSGAHVGRGAVIGANSLVNKPIPPYAVVVGTPARIIASKFTLEQIMRHERKLYPENERLSYQYLSELFSIYYKGKSSLGKDAV
jgi:acetyltransferase-like isoleucine patch superfamily enzyme